jgi:hypothetical protein
MPGQPGNIKNRRSTMSANNQYHEKRKEIEKAIEIMKQSLESMDINQKKDPLNYGYVGKCNYVYGLIEGINNFLSGY